MMYAGHIEEHSVSSEVGAAESWVGAVAVCRASDLAASGAGDGSVQLWALQDTNRVLEPLHKLPVVICLDIISLQYSTGASHLLFLLFSCQIIRYTCT